MSDASSDVTLRRLPLALAALLALTGLGLALWLTMTHFRGAHTELSIGCPLSGVFDCAAVDASPYAKLRGFPVALLAQAAFAAMLCLALFAAIQEPDQARPTGGTLILAAGSGIGFAGYLLGVSALVLGAFCGLCLALDAILVALLACALLAVPRPLDAARAALVRLPLRPEVWLAAVLFGGMTYLLDRNYASAVERVEELSVATFDQRFESTAVQEIPSRHGAPSMGPANAAVNVVVFSDFECPACRRTSTWLANAQRAHADEVRLEFRHFPFNKDCNPHATRLNHPNACRAAAASESAHLQGKFWELHDRFMSAGRQLTPDVIDAAAAAIGVDPGPFASEQTGRAGLAVFEDIKAGAALGLRSVPAIFVNGRRIHLRGPADLSLAIEREISRRRKD